VKIDQEQLVADTLAQLLVRVRAPRLIEAVFVKDVPLFTTEQATQLAGRMTPVASFTTTYPPSASRHANITTGALQFNDLVIGPGETFSFWDRLGPVTVDRGYAYAGAIINNKSDENVIGGGLCQVSTTLFNAVARAGYDVLERHAHGYYIDRYPLGFDAAVFEPGVDFRWKNDTQYPVLIKAYPYATALRFDLISVPTGRRVVIELTARHPVARLNPLWERFHGLQRPTRPTWTDAAETIRSLGHAVEVEREELPADPRGGTWDELVATTARRLCLRPERSNDVAAALEAEGAHADDPTTWTPPRRSAVTLWWDVPPPG